MSPDATPPTPNPPALTGDQLRIADTVIGALAGDGAHLRPDQLRAVSALVMAGAFKAMLPAVPWAMIGVYQGAALVLYLGLEALWARTAWGIRTVARPASSPIPAAS